MLAQQVVHLQSVGSWYVHMALVKYFQQSMYLDL
jgi:hypothetical protein